MEEGKKGVRAGLQAGCDFSFGNAPLGFPEWMSMDS